MNFGLGVVVVVVFVNTVPIVVVAHVKSALPPEDVSVFLVDFLFRFLLIRPRWLFVCYSMLFNVIQCYSMGKLEFTKLLSLV